MWGLLKERRKKESGRNGGGSLRIARPPRTRSALEMLTAEPSDADSRVPRPVRAPRPATLIQLLDENRNGTTSGRRKAVGPGKGQPRSRRFDDVSRDQLRLLTGEMPAVPGPVTEETPTTVVPAANVLREGLVEEDSMLEPLRDT